MNIPGKEDAVKTGQGFADKVADKAQNGIQEAKEGANSIATSASKNVESIRSGAGQALGKAVDKAQDVFMSIGNQAQKAKESLSDTQDSIVTYTRAQPVKALLFAATAGALLITVVRAFSSSKES